MKHILTTFATLTIFISSFAQVGIGTETPDPSAALDVSSTTLGLLIPRMSSAERDIIINPVNGLLLFNTDTDCINQYVSSIGWFEICGTEVIGVVEGCTVGVFWMNRNLGASQIAASMNDAAAFGDLYQWGRETDGHQIRTSGVTALEATSNTDSPGHNNFILTSDPPKDWRVPQNSGLWQGVAGVNNPCPSSFRIPTEAELRCERLSWSSNDAMGAFASPLKLTVGGTKNNIGTLNNVTGAGYYSSSSVSGIFARHLRFEISPPFAEERNNYRAYGMSIRCIKD